MAPLTVAVGEARPGETAPRRKFAQKDAPLERPADSSAVNIPDFLRECVSRNKSRPAMAWRDLKEIHTETKKVTKIVDGQETKVDKVWQFYELSKYNRITYPELLNVCESLAHGLVAIGIKPAQAHKLHIFALTSPKWMQTFLAASFQGIPVVTAYDTLGEQGLTHSFLQTESNAIFTDNALLGQLINPLKKAESVKIIIHGDELDPNDPRDNGKVYSDAKANMDKIAEIRPDIKFYSFAEVTRIGKENSDKEFYKAKPEDLSCIMYTSGSTGDPKGVVITHKNILAALGGISANAGRDLVKNTDRVIAFLPLAHIFELAFELINFWWGGCLGYANVKTLTDASVKNCNSDLIEFKPTIMVAVAAVWELVRKGVLGKVKQLPGLSQRIFWGAFKAKLTMANHRIPGSSLFDFVFKKVRAATGGELRVVLNGGSPISMDCQIFINTLICPMLIGYGLTETCANTTIVEHNHFELDVAGTLTGAITAKLIDVADAGYYAKNNQGEILLQGDCVTSEYYKNPKETEEAFTDDGWFKTGDIGEWTANGALRIIDRRKNLVKTQNGEYIALEKLESVYRSNPVVLNLCVYADQSKVKPIAIVLPNELHFKLFLAEENIYLESELKTKEISHLCEDKKVQKAVLNSLLATGKAQGLKGIEFLQNVVLLDEEWTPQNGFVTSAQKLQRKKILEACKDKVEAAYK